MRIVKLPVLLAGCAALAACGGGGGGGGGPRSTPTPTPAPSPAPTPTPTPTPSGTDFQSLAGVKSFDVTAARSRTTYVSTDGEVLSSEAERGDMVIRYDADADSYEVSYGILASRYGAGDKQEERIEGETQYLTADSGFYVSRSPYNFIPEEGRIMRDYVATAFWEIGVGSAGTATTYWTASVFGFPTEGALPVAGQATYLTDVVGVMAASGQEVAFVQGLADFVVDFSSGEFRLSGFMNETSIFTTGGSGGSLRFNAGGALGDANSFSGLLSYEGSHTNFVGTIEGQFFGPDAQEMGGVFDAASGDDTLVGTVTGHATNYASTSEGLRNFGLVDPRRTERYATREARLFWHEADGVIDWTSASNGGSTMVEYGPDGVELVSGPFTYRPDEADLVESEGAFLRYETEVEGEPASVRLFKVGEDNPDIVLTYASFGSAILARPPGSGQDFIEEYFVFGDETPMGIVTARSGSATYSGRAYGSAASVTHGQFDIAGSADFTVDFDTDRYEASLALTGTQGGVDQDFGTWSFASENLGTAVATGLDADDRGGMQIWYFGPLAHEIGGTFWLATGPDLVDDTIHIAGAVVATEN